ncbi:MAG: ribosomal protein [Candidatus Parcubacteria bacterium]|jgi:large subunit ribosomal protein L10
MANEKKQNQLQNLLEHLEQGSNFALVKFEKTTHIALETLRKQLRPANAQVRVVKNTLFEKAVNKLSKKHPHLNEFHKKAFPIKENTALLTLGAEWANGLKTFHDYSKKETTVSFKFGYLDESVYNGGDMTTIAQLPSREELIGKVIGGMKSPLYNITYALKFNMQKLVYVLNEKSKQA